MVYETNPRSVVRRAAGAVGLATVLVLGCSSDQAMAPDTTVASIDVTPGTGSLASFGESVQLSAVARNTGGTALTTSVFSWDSSDPTVATVDAAGNVTAVADGTTSVTATAVGVQSNAVTVTVAQALGLIDVAPGQNTLPALGDTLVFTAAGTDALGNPMTGFTWTWATSNGGVASVDSDGVATALASGSASITATSGTVSGSATLDVTPVPTARLVMADTVDVGTQLDVDVQLLTNGYGSAPGAFSFTLTFDPTKLQYNSATTAYLAPVLIDNVGGTLGGVVSKPTGLTGNVTGLSVVFDVIGGAGATSSLSVAIDVLVEAVTFIDITADGVGDSRSVFIQ